MQTSEAAFVDNAAPAEITVAMFDEPYQIYLGCSNGHVIVQITSRKPLAPSVKLQKQQSPTSSHFSCSSSLLRRTGR